MPPRLMTWNVSYEYIDLPGVPSWDDRRHAVRDLIHTADVIGLQEVTRRQVRDLSDDTFDVLFLETPLPPAGVAMGRERFGRDIAPELVEVALFVRKDQLTVVTTGHAWLSPQPTVPLSVGFGNQVPRQLLWVVAETTHGEQLVLATSHVDQRSTAPMLGVVAEQLGPAVRAAGRGVLFGDLNTHTDPEALQILLAQGWADSHPTGSLADDPTYLGELRGRPGRIDHILTSGAVSASGWSVVEASRGLSDHVAVAVDLELT